MNILGFDPGMGAIKLYGAHGHVELPSQIATNGSKRLRYATGLSRRSAPPHIETDAGSFYIGLGAHDYGRPIENLDYDRLTGSPEMQAIFYGALSDYPDLPPVFDSVVVGLPIETLSGQYARDNAAAVRNWLKGKHTWQTDGRRFQTAIQDVVITPQPVGALFDYVLDENSQVVPAHKSALKLETGVISIGFNTIELIVVRNKKPVDRFTAGSTAGVRRLLELINRDRLYSLGELDTQLRQGKLDIRDALPVWEREVTGVIESQWGDAWRRFARILLVGGGAVLLGQNFLHRFEGKAYLPDEPVLSIARGLYKLGQQRKRKG